MLETAEDGDGLADTWLANVNRLKPPLEGFVLFKMLSVLVDGGRTNTAKLAAPAPASEDCPRRRRPRPYQCPRRCAVRQ